jgi:UDP-N-acetylglucosamine--N-acetylmuramyl-(pentapeptide) pyrophosphoryl-undecaprenol N-acetylglucosamine transferase
VLHAAGIKNADDVVSALPAGMPAPWVVVPYIDRMPDAYAASDLAMCRSGAMTCAELAAVGLPAAYVPLPHGNGEQRLNALPTVRAGGGLLVEDAALTPEWVRAELLPVLADRGRLAAMSTAARASSHRDAAAEIVTMVRNAASERRRAAARHAAR